MNGVQATVLAATAAPAEAGVASANQNSKRVRDFSPTRSSFEKHFKKACQVQRDKSPSDSVAREKSEPVEAETGPKEERVEQVKEQPLKARPYENQNTEKAGDGVSGSDAQAGASTSSIMAQVMAAPFMGLVKVDANPLQQEIQAGAGGAAVNASINPEVLSFDANQETPQLITRTIEAINTVKTDSPAAQPSVEPQAAVFVNDDASIKTQDPEKTAPVDTQAQTKMGAGRPAGELKGPAIDEKDLKKTEKGADGGTGKKLTEFESHRVSVVRPAKDANLAEGQQRSSTGGEDTANSPVMQQVEADIPKAQVRDVPTGVQNNRALVDPQALIDQVVKKAELLVKDNRSEMTLQLKPGFLGKMTIKIAVDEAGTVTAHFSTSSQQVKNALEQNIQTLRQTLEAQGLKVDRTEVNVQLDSGGMMSDPGGRQDLWQQPRGGLFTGLSDSEGDISPAASQMANPVPTGGYETAEAGDGYNFLV